MSRIENTEGLFGSNDCEKTTSDVRCDLCRATYPRYDDADGLRNNYVEFGDFLVCECCYEKVEKAVFQNMKIIIPWFIRIIKKRDEINERDKKLVSQLKEELMK